MRIFTPKVGQIFDWNGTTVRWRPGHTLIEEGAAVLKGREHLVKPVKIHHPADEAAPSRRGKRS